MKTKNNTKVFKFFNGENYYAVSATTEQEAKDCLFESAGEMEIEKVEEIPESKWDEKIIEVYEDNDRSKKSFKISIREAMCEIHPQIVYTNDSDLLD